LGKHTTPLANQPSFKLAKGKARPTPLRRNNKTKQPATKRIMPSQHCNRWQGSHAEQHGLIIHMVKPVDTGHHAPTTKHQASEDSAEEFGIPESNRNSEMLEIPDFH
jgi:hypothetical protein